MSWPYSLRGKELEKSYGLREFKMAGWKTAIGRRSKTNKKWKRKLRSLHELKAFTSFLAWNESRDQQWATTLETVVKKQWPWYPKFLLLDEFFRTQLKKISKKTNQRKKERKKDKQVLDFTLIKWLKDFIAFRFPNKLIKHQIH